MLVKKLPSESYLEAAKHMFMDSSLPLISEERLNDKIISDGCPRSVFIKADRLCKRDGFDASTVVSPCAVCWMAAYNGEEPTSTAYKYMHMCQARCDY